MKRVRPFSWLGTILLLVLLTVSGVDQMIAQQSEPIRPYASTAVSESHRETETIPILDIRDFGYQPLSTDVLFPNERQTAFREQSAGPGSRSNNPYTSLDKWGSAYAELGSTIRYAITIANYEPLTHTYILSDTLPPLLSYIEGSATDGLIYQPDSRTLTWEGALSPGNLDYVYEENTASIPYLDLGGLGVGNICDEFIDPDNPDLRHCDDVTMTFNLGINGYTFNLYGEEQYEIVLSSNGIALTTDDLATTPTQPHNQRLMDTTEPNHLLAPLWTNLDMTDDGRWSAAIITHWIDGYDVFYAEWHNAPHAADLDLTTRFAIAVILNGGTAHTGDAYFIYDNFSDPDLSVARGFTIGIEDKLGYRGFTYAYAPCCNDPFPVQGYPPPTGTTLKITPVIFGENYQHTMSYEIVINGQVPQVIPNTVQLSSDSNDPAIRFMWDTHYLYVRLMVYIPMIISDSQ